MDGWLLSSVCFESRQEVLRHCTLLPCRRVLDVGANTFSVNHGHGRIPMHLVPRTIWRHFHRTACIFYLDRAAAGSLLQQLSSSNAALMLPKVDWLTSILLCRNTFEHHLLACRGGGEMLEPRGLPFILLPALRCIRVGFLHRWVDVSIVEGRAATVLEEVPDLTTTIATPAIPFMLRHMAIETVQNTRRDVEALEAAGIAVIWCFLHAGVTRVLDIEDYVPPQP